MAAWPGLELVCPVPHTTGEETRAQSPRRRIWSRPHPDRVIKGDVDTIRWEDDASLRRRSRVPCAIPMQAERIAIACGRKTRVPWQRGKIHYVHSRPGLFVIPVAGHLPSTLRDRTPAESFGHSGYAIGTSRRRALHQRAGGSRSYTG